MAIAPSPVVTLSGVVHGATPRTVVERPARPAVPGVAGVQLYRRAVEYRAAYEAVDVLVLTDGGGFGTVVYHADDLRGVLPQQGDPICVRVRPYNGLGRDVNFGFVENVKVSAQSVPKAA